MNFKLEPVKRDGNGKLIADYTVRDFYEKLAEELFEAHEQAVTSLHVLEVKELLDLMTVCATRINFLLDYDCDIHLGWLQKSLIDRNRERGYFEEVPNVSSES